MRVLVLGLGFRVRGEGETYKESDRERERERDCAKKEKEKGKAPSGIEDLEEQVAQVVRRIPSVGFGGWGATRRSTTLTIKSHLASRN